MRAFPLIIVTVLITLYGFAWHDKPAQEPDSARRTSSMDRETLAIWGLVAISFAAFFFAGCLIWAKCSGK